MKVYLKEEKVWVEDIEPGEMKPVKAFKEKVTKDYEEAVEKQYALFSKTNPIDFMLSEQADYLEGEIAAYQKMRDYLEEREKDLKCLHRAETYGFVAVKIEGKRYVFNRFPDWSEYPNGKPWKVTELLEYINWRQKTYGEELPFMDYMMEADMFFNI